MSNGNGAEVAKATPLFIVPAADMQKLGPVGPVGPHGQMTGEYSATSADIPAKHGTPEAGFGPVSVRSRSGWSGIGPQPPASAPVTPRPPRESKLLQRRNAKKAAAITGWYGSLPEADRLPYYSPAAIERAIGAGIQEFAPAMRALGWRRVQTRIAGLQCVVWVAPGAMSPKRARGRPPSRLDSHQPDVTTHADSGMHADPDTEATP